MAAILSAILSGSIVPAVVRPFSPFVSIFLLSMQRAGLKPACGCSKHRLIYERTLLLGHASEQLLPLPVALLCCLCGLVLPEVLLQVHESVLRFQTQYPVMLSIAI